MCELYADFTSLFPQKGKNLDEFNIPAHMDADRQRVLQEQEQSAAAAPDLSAQEMTTQSPARPLPEQAPPTSTYRPRPLGVFTGFDDDD
jgi:hypothetical protein